jgi:hypothetical protein
MRLPALALAALLAIAPVAEAKGKRTIDLSTEELQEVYCKVRQYDPATLPDTARVPPVILAFESLDLRFDKRKEAVMNDVRCFWQQHGIEVIVTEQAIAPDPARDVVYVTVLPHETYMDRHHPISTVTVRRYGIPRRIQVRDGSAGFTRFQEHRIDINSALWDYDLPIDAQVRQFAHVIKHEMGHALSLPHARDMFRFAPLFGDPSDTSIFDAPNLMLMEGAGERERDDQLLTTAQERQAKSYLGMGTVYDALGEGMECIVSYRYHEEFAEGVKRELRRRGVTPTCE